MRTISVDGEKPTDPRGNDGGCAQAIRLRKRCPPRLGECLFRCREPEEDEPVDLALVFRRKDGIRIKASIGIFFQRGDRSTDLRRQVSHHVVRKPPDAGATSQKTRRGVTAPRPVTTIRRIYSPVDLGVRRQRFPSSLFSPAQRDGHDEGRGGRTTQLLRRDCRVRCVPSVRSRGGPQARRSPRADQAILAVDRAAKNGRHPRLSSSQHSV